MKKGSFEIKYTVDKKFQKLPGAENYASWTYQMKAVLKVEDLWDTIKAPPETADARYYLD